MPYHLTMRHPTTGIGHHVDVRTSAEARCAQIRFESEGWLDVKYTKLRGPRVELTFDNHIRRALAGRKVKVRR